MKSEHPDLRPWEVVSQTIVDDNYVVTILLRDCLLKEAEKRAECFRARRLYMSLRAKILTYENGNNGFYITYREPIALHRMLPAGG